MNWRSIGAIAAGVVFIVVVTTLVDIMLHAVPVFPPMDQPIDDRLSALATSYAPMTHAKRRGYVGVVIGLVGLVTTWNMGYEARRAR